MSALKHSRTRFDKILEKFKEDFEKAVQFFDAGDLSASAELTQDILKGILREIGELEQDYKNALLTRRFPELAEDIDHAKKFQTSESTRDNLANYLPTLSRSEDAIRNLEKEIGRLYPKPWPGQRLVERHWKKGLLGLAGFLIIFFLGSLYHQERQKRTGLKGDYFADINLKKRARERRDSVINFRWGMDSPFSKWKRDNFSVRWSGYLEAPQDGRYEIYTHSDDGVRLWIDGLPVIDNWTVHRMTVDHATVNLQKGYHPIKLEYFEKARQAVIRLLWQPVAGRKPVPIPRAYLVPSQDLLRPGIPVADDDPLSNAS